MLDRISVSELKDKTITSINGMEKGSDEIIFLCSDGSKYKMYHEQDCCENVAIEDVCGNISDLIGSELLIAEEATNESELSALREYDESYTWTFYKFATRNGYVDLRWYGTSNGYYSESVYFVKL
jgi:hypothetical protein